MKSVLAAAALVLAFAGSAEAEAITATLSTPLEKPRRVVFESTIWDCRDSQCTVVTGPEAGSWQACRGLVRSVGPVTAYSSLDAAKLDRCNGKK